MTDAAIASIVTGVVTIATLAIGVLTLWLKLRYGEQKVEEIDKKVDHNTSITKQGTEDAVKRAKIAAEAAAATKEVADKISNKLNGGIDSAIESAVKPLQETMDKLSDRLAEHIQAAMTQFEQDESSLRDLRTAVNRSTSVLEDILRRTK